MAKGTPFNSPQPETGPGTGRTGRLQVEAEAQADVAAGKVKDPRIATGIQYGIPGGLCATEGCGVAAVFEVFHFHLPVTEFKNIRGRVRQVGFHPERPSVERGGAFPFHCVIGLARITENGVVILITDIPGPHIGLDKGAVRIGAMKMDLKPQLRGIGRDIALEAIDIRAPVIRDDVLKQSGLKDLKAKPQAHQRG